MPTSGSSVITYTRDQIIKAALRKIGVLAQGGTPSSTQLTEATEALNLLVATFVTDGLQVWKQEEYTLTLVAGQKDYTIPVKLLKVTQAFRRSTDNIDTPMRILTRQEYNMLGNKSLPQGTPIQLYHQPTSTASFISLFPIPGTVDATSVIKITHTIPLEIFNLATDNPDFPQEWYEALVYGLADRLAPEYGVDLDTRRMIKSEANQAHQTAKDWDQEEGSFYFKRDVRTW